MPLNTSCKTFILHLVCYKLVLAFAALVLREWNACSSVNEIGLQSRHSAKWAMTVCLAIHYKSQNLSIWSRVLSWLILSLSILFFEDVFGIKVSI